LVRAVQLLVAAPPVPLLPTFVPTTTRSWRFTIDAVLVGMATLENQCVALLAFHPAPVLVAAAAAVALRHSVFVHDSRLSLGATSPGSNPLSSSSVTSSLLTGCISDRDVRVRFVAVVYRAVTTESANLCSAKKLALRKALSSTQSRTVPTVS